MGISIGQLLIILVIVALLFGTKKLRNVGGDIGSAIKSFRNALKENEQDKAPKNGNIIDGNSKTDDNESGTNKP